MLTVNIHEAKTHLSRLIERVSAGEEIIIAKAGKPVARLGPPPPPRQDRIPGQDRGLFDVPEDFDGPLPDEIQVLFEA